MRFARLRRMSLHGNINTAMAAGIVATDLRAGLQLGVQHVFLDSSWVCRMCFWIAVGRAECVSGCCK